MKAKVSLILVAVLIVAAFVWGFRRMRAQHPDEDERPAGGAQAKHEPPPSGTLALTLDLATQKRIGLQTTKIGRITLPPEIKGYARVLDSSSLIGLLKDLATARNDLDASSKGYQRVKGLYSQGVNASAQALETAEAAVNRDQIALRAAEAQLEAAWGKSVANQPDLTAFVRSLASMETAIVRLDVPVGEFVSQPPVGARLLPPGKSAAIALRFLGRALATDPQIQGQGFLFLADNASTALTPGLILPGYLQLHGEPRRGVMVPDDAVVRFGGGAWIYVQTGDQTFARRYLNLEQPVNEGWFVAAGVSPDEQVVVVGAQTLLSEEMKDQIKADDG